MTLEAEQRSERRKQVRAYGVAGSVRYLGASSLAFFMKAASASFLGFDAGVVRVATGTSISMKNPMVAVLRARDKLAASAKKEIGIESRADETVLIPSSAAPAITNASINSARGRTSR